MEEYSLFITFLGEFSHKPGQKKHFFLPPSLPGIGRLVIADLKLHEKV
jgi:hypothetical protein